MKSVMIEANDKENVNWKKEALAIYFWLLKLEEEKNSEIEAKFKEFEKKIKLLEDSPSIFRDPIFTHLQNELYEEFSNDASIRENLVIFILVQKMMNSFKEEYNSLLNDKTEMEKLVSISNDEGIIKDLTKEIIVNEKKLENIFSKYQNRSELIFSTETFRSVNQKRWEIFKEMGYKYKTSYMIDDDRTCLDSRYFNSLKQIRKMDENFEYVWDGKIRRFLYPPDRPNDRSILIPHEI